MAMNYWALIAMCNPLTGRKTHSLCSSNHHVYCIRCLNISFLTLLPIQPNCKFDKNVLSHIRQCKNFKDVLLRSTNLYSTLPQPTVTASIRAT